MLRKLLKYDFRSVIKEFSILWPAALVMALVMRFTLSMADAEIMGFDIASTIATLVYFGILVAMVVVTLIFIIQRFFRGILGEEGYLMNTLPVKPWQLVMSKLISAMVVTILSTFIALLSILLLIPSSLYDVFGVTFQVIVDYFSSGRPDYILYVLEFLALMLLSVSSSITMFYLSMAIGHLFGRNRIAASVIAYIALNAAVNALMMVLAVAAAMLDINMDFIAAMTAQQALHAAFLLMIAGCLVLTLIYYFATTYIIKRHLNLE